jgi:hypothetical protein
MQSGWLDQFMRREREQSAPEESKGPDEAAGRVSRREFLHGGLAAGSRRA